MRCGGKKEIERVSRAYFVPGLLLFDEASVVASVHLAVVVDDGEEVVREHVFGGLPYLCYWHISSLTFSLFAPSPSLVTYLHLVSCWSVCGRC